MTRQEIEEKVIQITDEVIPSSSLEQINLDSSFIEDLGADSLMMFDLIQEVEATFKIQVEEEDIENIKRVKDAVDRIEIELQKRK